MSLRIISSKSWPTNSFLIQTVKQLSTSASRCASDSSKILDDTDEATKQIRKELADLPDKDLYPEYKQEGFGWVYDKKPFKYNCKAGKAYLWCACGRSHQQVLYSHFDSSNNPKMIDIKRI